MAGRSYGARTGSSHHRRGSSQTPILGMVDMAIGEERPATAPYGTVGNPAELIDEHAVEAAVAATVKFYETEKPANVGQDRGPDIAEEEKSNKRASWVSRVFRASRSWLNPPMSPATIATATTVSNARSDSHLSRSSRWTEKTSSGDWEAFVRECEAGRRVPALPDEAAGWSWNMDHKGKGREMTASMGVMLTPDHVRIVGTGGPGMSPQLGPDGSVVRRGTLGEKLVSNKHSEKDEQNEATDTSAEREKPRGDSGLLKPGGWGVGEGDDASSTDNRFSFDRLSEGTFGMGRRSAGARTTGSGSVS